MRQGLYDYNTSKIWQGGQKFTRLNSNIIFFHCMKNFFFHPMDIFIGLSFSDGWIGIFGFAFGLLKILFHAYFLSSV